MKIQFNTKLNDDTEIIEALKKNGLSTKVMQLVLSPRRVILPNQPGHRLIWLKGMGLPIQK